MTVRDLLAHAPSGELAEWMAYEAIAGPLGPRRGDLQAAVIAATIVNSQRGKNQRPRPLSDFLLTWDRRPKTPEELWQAAMAANTAIGGTVRR